MDGLHVSSVEGHAVTRYGTTGNVRGVPQPGLLIGAERDPRDPSKVTHFPGRIVHIPEAEAVKYAREYARVLRCGALMLRTAEEYAAQEGGSK